MMKNKLLIKEINILQAPMPKRKSSYWYGGNLIEFDLSNKGKLVVSAEGDISLVFYAIKTDKEVEWFKDKNNGGSLYDRLSHFVASDEKLYKMINHKHQKYYCEIGNNNWFEVNYIDSHGNFCDMCNCFGGLVGDNILEIDSIEDIIPEIKDNFEMYIEYINILEKNLEKEQDQELEKE